MSIKEYTIITNGKCHLCGDTEDIVIDEEGDEICTDCLFERDCEEQWNEQMYRDIW